MSNVFEKIKNKSSHCHSACTLKFIFCTQTLPHATFIIQDSARSFTKQKSTVKKVDVLDRDEQRTERDRMQLHFLSNDNIKL